MHAERLLIAIEQLPRQLGAMAVALQLGNELTLLSNDPLGCGNVSFSQLQIMLDECAIHADGNNGSMP